MNVLKRILYAVFVNQIDATQFSTTRSWRNAPLQDARLDITKSHRTVLQSKSRDWELSSAFYQSLASTWEQYTVGTGIQLPAASSDEEWNKVADEEWEKSKPLLNIETRLGFDNDQGIVARRDFVDGEHFLILTREGAYPRYQMAEGHRCFTPESLASYEGKQIFDGVRVENTGRVLGYYFDGSTTLVDAGFVVHVHEPGRARQYRGIPRCTASLNILHDLQDLRLLEMVAAKDAAELSTIYKTESGEMPASLVSMAQKFRSTSTANGATGSVTDNRREYYQSAVGGKNIVLQRGDSATQHIPERPGTNTREYWRLLQADVCADAKIPLSIIYPDSMQGTVFRGSISAFASFCRGVTAVYSTHFARVRNYTIRSATAYNSKLAKLPRDWQKVSPGTVRSPDVDIGRNSSAAIAELKAGIRTFCGLAAELGKDGKQLLREKAAEIAFIKELAKENNISPRDISDALEEELANLPASFSRRLQTTDA